MKCVEVAADAIWIGEATPIDCVNIQNCRQRGCYWRRFHELKPEQFARRERRQEDLFA